LNFKKQIKAQIADRNSIIQGSLEKLCLQDLHLKVRIHELKSGILSYQRMGDLQ